MSSKFVLTAAITAAIVLTPITALAQTTGSVEVASYMGIAVAAWFLLDKLIEISPLRENTLIAAIRDFLNGVLSKKHL